MFESIPDYRKRKVLRFLMENEADLLNECGCLKNDIDKLNKHLKNNLMEQNEEYLE